MEDVKVHDDSHDPADDIEALEALAEQYDVAEADRKMIVAAREFIVRVTPGQDDGDFNTSDRIKYARDMAVIAAFECSQRIFSGYNVPRES